MKPAKGMIDDEDEIPVKIAMDADERPVFVVAAPGATPAQEARIHLYCFAREMFTRAADAHATGMSRLKTSTRIEQLADIVSDEMAVKVRDIFLSEGILELKADKGMPSQNSSGGDA
jgi:hypothetical protein